jgi:phosphohistidine phosphatase
MKHLLIIRHAKTEQQNYENDFERKLTKRGIADCELMCDRLKTFSFNPDCIKISSAKRTIETANLLAKGLGWDKSEFDLLPALYLASKPLLLETIKSTPKHINNLVVIAHNPGMTDLFNSLGQIHLDNLPTCGMALFRLNKDSWETLVNAELVWFNWPSKSV